MPKTPSFPRMPSRMLPLAVLIWMTLTLPDAQARAPGEICDAAAALAAGSSNVPVDGLLAITRTETGRRRDGKLEPWPWTVNMEGKGVWFETREEALAYVEKHHARGARSFDIGCFQINFRWHGAGFASLDEMFDPAANARYAARFLSELYAESGDWSVAAGMFHSRTASLAETYRARFDRFRTARAGTPAPAPLRSLAARRGGPGYPLLHGISRPAAFGSLVPQGDRARGVSLLQLAPRAGLLIDARG